MYVSKSILILIAALGASATNSIARKLYARELHYTGSIAGYHDGNCTGNPVVGVTAGDGTKVLPHPVFDGSKDHCLTFNTPAEYLGIKYGAFDVVIFYRDPHCESHPDIDQLNKHDPFWSLFSYPTVDQCVRNTGGVIGSFLFLKDDGHAMLKNPSSATFSHRHPETNGYMF